MKILVLGKTGQVGRSLQKTLPHSTFWGREELDLSRPKTVRHAVLELEPDCIINAAAYTAVDRAESEPELTNLVNAVSVEALAHAAEEIKIPLVYVSTDYVFSGELDRPYVETDEPAPKSVYGTTKLAGEQAIQAHCSRYWIFRTSWVFSEYGHNFVKSMLQLGRERDSLSIVNDQRGRPTYAGHIAEVIEEVIDRWQAEDPMPWGIYHLASAGEVTWYEFAQEIFRQAVVAGVLEKAPELKAISTEHFPTLAARPRNSSLEHSKLEQYLRDPLPDWKKSLKKVISL